MPLYLDGKANVSFTSRGGQSSLLLDANCAYYFARSNDGRITLNKIGLGGDETLTNGRPLPGSASQAPMANIAVKIFVDEEEPARDFIWQRRLRRRVEAASAVFEKYFHVRFQVVAFGTWNSDNRINDFFDSLAEFEREAKPAPATLAIGFTSQWRMVHGRTHMAGTRGPLHSHILAREGSPEIGEPEKLEFLVHELGHLLGAAHSPEQDSIMRPVLGAYPSGRVNHEIQFDPVNTLAIAMITEEMRRRKVTKIGELLPETRKRLGQIYSELARALPDDPAAYHYAQLVRSDSGTPIVTATRQVLKEISRAALDNRSLPAAETALAGQVTRREGDALTNYLVRKAARSAQMLPEDVKLRAFLLAIAVGLNDDKVLAQLPATGKLMAAIETPSERRLRLVMLGEPTIRKRRDLARQFLLATLLASTTSNDAAETAVVAKELSDAERSSGFSFVDVAAGRAGARFARGVLDKRIPLGLLALAFSASSYMPAVNGLPDHLSAQEFSSQYGDKDDPRFTKAVEQIDKRITLLPGYRPPGPTLKF